MTNLITIGGDAKTPKGEKRGFLSGVTYKAPAKSSGFQVCAKADLAGCSAPCLNVSGRGGMSKDNAKFSPYGVELPDNTVQRARIWRTRLFFQNREKYKALLRKEISGLIKKAEKRGMLPVYRPNGTSDVEVQALLSFLFSEFPELQVYDYTKIAKRFYRPIADNYHLTLSYSQYNADYAADCLKTFRETSASLAVVVRDELTKTLFTDHYERLGVPVVDGDETDLRFLDPDNSLVLLRAKGPAKKDASGFVLDEPFAV